MLSFVVVLHSTTGRYSNTLVSDAMRATAAISYSISGASPDFVPPVTIVRADPVVGYDYLYESVLPDRNHVVSHSTSAVRAPGSPSWHAHRDGRGGDRHGHSAAQTETEDGAWSAAQAFRARSLLYAQECIQALHDPATAAAHDAHAAESRKGKPWSCLAGALMSVLCYVNRHTVLASPSDASTTGGAPRTVVLVFSDGDESPAQATFDFVDECAFAVATVQFAKCGLPLFAFGAAVAAAAPSLAQQASSTGGGGGGGGSRLRAVAASLAGFTAARFSFAHVGALLDSHLDDTASEEATRPSAPSASRMPPGVVVHDVDAVGDSQSVRKQRRRARLVDQYCPCPVVLPRTEATPPTRATAGLKRTRRRTAKAKEEEEVEGVEPFDGEHVSRDSAAVSSHLGWLCPHCTAIVYRSEEEVLVGTVAPICPYCAEDHTS